MKIQLKRIDNDYHFELKNERGHTTFIDSKAAVGGHDLAPSPMEYVLMGVAGCSAIDIISILKKQKQEITIKYKKIKPPISCRANAPNITLCIKIKSFPVAGDFLLELE